MAVGVARARQQPGGRRQVVDIAVRDGYRPQTILARAGMPLRIRFRREDDDPCTERVVFSAPRLDRRLAPRGVTVVDLPAQPAGEIRFTCGMGRYRGRITLTNASAPSGAHTDRNASRIRLRLWLAFSLVVAVAFVFLDGAALAAVVALALIGWLAAWGRVIPAWPGNR